MALYIKELFCQKSLVLGEQLVPPFLACLIQTT
ncbi:MAG: hypothetical protein MRERC_1c090 [Mycoplasmataceae bacterium RC_NB112A]|nr:MAG: hypothetical protein MRERC_1c090 [Mycoplasmataceae bacterium RC_NB112A]